MTLRGVAVIVPARDEQETIGACLQALAIAAGHVRMNVLTVVVADHCLDQTAIVAAATGATVVVRSGSPDGGVGAARATGCDHALTALAGLQNNTIWLAHTDADSQVPPDWLRTQLALADQGYRAVAGMVTLTGAGDCETRRRWASAYRRRHGHIHGASLGVRADAYLEIGGFEPVPAHEDLRLVQRLLAAGYPVARPRHPRVVTSSRLTGRTPAGVAADLRNLR